MIKLHGLKVRRYAAYLIDVNKHLALFPVETLFYKTVVTELNEILLNSMPTSWSKQAYVQDFDCKYITFKNQLTCLNAWRFQNISMKV